MTDANGQFQAPDLVPGRYTVRFELTGFSKVERADVNVLLGRTFQLDAQMRVGELTETVQVTAEASPLVDTRSTLVAHNVTAEEFDRIPKGRSFQSVAMTAPSVNSGIIEGGFQVNGASGSENQFTVDGVATNSLLNGQSRQDTVFEYLQEVQVKTVGIPAEFGGALGGVISAVTKSRRQHVPRRRALLLSRQRARRRPGAETRALARRRRDGPLHPGRRTDRQSPRDRRLTRRPDRPRPAVLLRVVLAAFRQTHQRVRVQQRHRDRRPRRSEADDHQRLRQGQLLEPAPQRVLRLRCSRRPRSEGTLLAYTGLGPQFTSTSRAAYEPNRTRGFETTQRNFTGNADINLSNSTFLSVKAGKLLRQLRGHGRSFDDAVPVSCDFLDRDTRRSGEPAGRRSVLEHACRR